MLAERWDGKRWAIQPIPQGTISEGQLLGVSCVSASACVAVGNYGTGTAEIVERWNGSRWFLQSIPLPSDAVASDLYGVSCVSARACMAVGDVWYVHTVTPLVESWDGRRWAIQRTAHLSDQPSELDGVSCVSPRACTAVGSENVENLVERWDGKRWAIEPTPKPLVYGLGQVSCVSARACIAVGSYVGGNDYDRSLAERWDGTDWAVQPTPNPPRELGDGLDDVSCPSARTCTAVGGASLIESWAAPSDKFTVSHIKAAADGTITFSIRAPGRGSVDVLGTAWQDNLARAAVLAKPAAARFVFARQHVHAAHGGTVSVTVKPDRRGRRLVARHRYRVVLRLWVTYTPSGGFYRTVGLFGLHLLGICAKHSTVTALHTRTVARCN